MDPSSYCEDKAVSPGSDIYYSLLKLDSLKRKAIVPVLAFCKEVSDINTECHDAAVANKKFDWWRNEIRQLFEGEPNHPVSLALEPVIHNHDLQDAYFLEIIDGFNMPGLGTISMGANELRLYDYRTSSVPCMLIADICGDNDRSTQKFASQAGLILAQIDHIQNLGQDIRRGHHFISTESLQEHQVLPDQLLQPVTPVPLKSLLQERAAAIREQHQSALALLDKSTRKSQRYLVTRLALAVRLLDTLEQDGFRVLEHRLELTPLRKLWISWRS